MFTPEVIDQLADVLAAEVLARIEPALSRAPAAPRGWLDSSRAADYLAISRNALHKIGSDELPRSQDGGRAPCYYRPADLDAYRLRCMVGDTNACSFTPDVTPTHEPTVQAVPDGAVATVVRGQFPV